MDRFVNRRIVTGLNGDGRSCVVFDDEIVPANASTSYIWRSSLPADNSGSDDVVTPFSTDMVHYSGSNFLRIEFAPGTKPYLHATDTLDYFVMLAGKVTMELETGLVDLFPGDLVVNRGVVHGWRNDGPETAILAAVTVPASPVGEGRTI